jgi:hypothetical protein
MALQTKLADKLADFRHFRSVRYNKCGKGVKDGLRVAFWTHHR